MKMLKEEVVGQNIGIKAHLKKQSSFIFDVNIGGMALLCRRFFCYLKRNLAKSTKYPVHTNFHVG